MKTKYATLSTGFAMFSMFFGSGNLVYPLLIGASTQAHWHTAALGLLLTGVVVPFLGLLGVLLFEGSTKNFFGTLGSQASFWISLLTLSLMGPFGVLARCITVAHGSVRLLFPELGLVAFSLLFCGLIFILTMKKNKIVPLLGTVLTPLLLCALAAIAYFGITKGEWALAGGFTHMAALKIGLLKGYQLMDLLAAFFFSAFIFRHIKGQTESDNPSAIMGAFMKSAFIGVGLLSTVYVLLTALGASYSDALKNVPPEEMLGTIAYLTMGKYAGIAISTAVALACFTTGVVLATLYSDFLQHEVFKEKTNSFVTMTTTLAIAFFVSTLKFSGIAAFIEPILETLYPALIVLTVINILNKRFDYVLPKWPIALAFAGKVLLF